jgi:prophage regulatory protein
VAPDDDNLPDRVLRIAEVVTMVGMAEATVWREVKAGRFPPPLMISPRCRGWRLSTLIAWLKTRPTAPPP